MPPRRRRQQGLDAAAVVALRERVAAGGRAPRVGISGPQFPAGTTGAVVRVGDPDLDGTDFVTVRVKLGSVTDELTFAPSELTPTTKVPTSKAPTTDTPTTRAPTTQAPTTQAPSTKAPSTKAPGARVSTVTPSEGASAGARAAAPDESPDISRQPPRPEQTDRSPKSQGPKTQSPTTRKPGQRKPGPRKPTAQKPRPQKVTITVVSDGADWSISAQRGARVVLRRTTLRPGVVGAIAELIADPAVLEAVSAVNDSARELAESRAATLRAELAELDAVLATHRRPDHR